MGHMSADQPKITLKVGQPLGASPPNEGYMPVVKNKVRDRRNMLTFMTYLCNLTST